MPGRTEGSDSNQMLSFNHDRFSGGKNHVGLRLLLLREIGDRFGVIGRIHNTKEGGTMKKHSLINLSQALILLTKPVLGILVMVFLCAAYAFWISQRPNSAGRLQGQDS